MVKIGVRFPASISQAGEYLADATAVETAGADSIWVGGTATAPGGADLDPWILLAGIAAVTHRIRLGGVPWSPAEEPAAQLARRVTALEHLSRGRVLLGMASVDNEHVEPLRQLLAGSAGVRPKGPPIFISGREGDYDSAARLGDGLIQPEQSPTDLAESATRLSEVRATAGREGDFELWMEATVPPTRAAWAQSLAALTSAGLTGVIVPWEPRLVDLLRNPDDEDERGDLLIAAG